MASIEVKFPHEDEPSRIKKWRVSTGTMVTTGRILLLYQDVATGKVEKKLKAQQFGRVLKLLIKENEVVHPGQTVLIMEGCKHPTVIKDLCAECGADLREEFADQSALTQANVPMVHSIPELKVTEELAMKIGREDRERLLKHRQLVLLVDLDQTIVHTTNDNIPANMEDVTHFQLYGPNSPWYHTRLRPHTRQFLAEVSKYYELHICTFGARQYAHRVAKLLDDDGKLFSHRILSRDECFDPQSKTANLKALFPCGVDMVCIIDDRDDVWQGCANLVQVKPYHFFLHTGDINVPPGLGKHDDPLPQSISDQVLQDMNKDPENSEDVKNEEAEKKDNINEIETEAKETEKAEEKTEEKVEEKTEENTEEKTEEKVEEKIEENTEEIAKNENSAEDSKDAKQAEVENNDSKKSDEKDKNKSLDKVENNEKVNNENLEYTEDNQKYKSSCTETSKCKKKHGKHKKEKKHIMDDSLPIVNPEGFLEEDQDDYLLYLEDILKRIHAEFYSGTETEIRSKTLREIIPKVRSHVLQGLCLTFSGLVPNNQRLHQSRAYKVARAFGAQVTQDISEQTTHLVAIQPGTVKVRAAKKQGKVKIVNPDWLWTCAERWERVDERLYPLKEVPLHKAREFRKPPAHCSTPEHIEDDPTKSENSFANSINPLMVFTQEEIANMDKEVEEDISDLEDILDESEEENNRKREYDSDSSDVYGYEPPSPKKKKKDSDDESGNSNSSNNEGNKTKQCYDKDDDDDDPVTCFRRGEGLPDDLDLGDNSQDSVEDLVADDMEEEREWNAMGEALEREFLSE